jgi:hypothetical protein
MTLFCRAGAVSSPSMPLTYFHNVVTAFSGGGADVQ